MDKTLLKAAPIALCSLLSPFTPPDEVKKVLNRLNNNQALLDRVIECANSQMVSTTLYAALKQHDLLQTLPDLLQDYLIFLHQEMLERNQRLQSQTQSIVKTLNQAGIMPLLMKGGDTLFYDLYPSQGCRFMSDIDILLPEGKVPLAKKCLFDKGYTIPEKFQAHKKDKDAHHMAPIYKEGNDCAIELHYKPLSKKAFNMLTLKETFAAAYLIPQLEAQGKEAYAFSPTHKLLHCYLHSEITHAHQHTDTLIILQMDYFVRLYRQYAEVIDWDVFNEQLDRMQLRSEFSVYAYKAQRLFSLPKLPNSVMVSKQMLHTRYQSALVSTMSKYYPWRRFTNSLYHGLSKESLQHQFTINNNADYAVALVKKLSYQVGLLLSFKKSLKMFQKGFSRYS